ncbi:MAG: hypothetical protein QOH46_2304 [Solirubrobacteraceae bacterium]|nr:hypothetical protein [Solirubrobacteraceae bacterium]
MGYDEAFGVIHDRYRQRLFAYTRQMLPGARSDAEDVLQDVFLRAYSALRDDDRPVTLRAWLYRVAHNRCVDQLRRPAPAASEIFDMSRLPLHDPLIETQLREDLRRLVCDVRRLPEQQRSALLMRELEGLGYGELADALGVTVPAVKSLLVRARMGLMEAGEARDAPCADIRAELSLAYDRGVRASGRARRHLRDCAGCRGYKRALRGASQAFGALSGGGAWTTIAKVLGLGGAGSGAAVGGGAMGGSGATLGGSALAGGGAALGGTGAAVAGGGAVVAKVAVAVCCAAVVGGGAAEVGQHVHARPEAQAAAARGAVPQARAAPSTGGEPATVGRLAGSAADPVIRRVAVAPAGLAAEPLVIGRAAQPTVQVPGAATAPVAALLPRPAAEHPGGVLPPDGLAPASAASAASGTAGGIDPAAVPVPAPTTAPAPPQAVNAAPPAAALVPATPASAAPSTAPAPAAPASPTPRPAPSSAPASPTTTPAPAAQTQPGASTPSASATTDAAPVAAPVPTPAEPPAGAPPSAPAP